MIVAAVAPIPARASPQIVYAVRLAGTVWVRVVLAVAAAVLDLHHPHSLLEILQRRIGGDGDRIVLRHRCADRTELKSELRAGDQLDL